MSYNEAVLGAAHLWSGENERSLTALCFILHQITKSYFGG